MTPGTRLGPYEIVSPLGAGGMGEVYRAKDTKLNRDVAIKVLPESFALDADRVARFTREAQVLASLNHPNIAQIYGIEESNVQGPGSSVRALVMELVEGQDLSTLIATHTGSSFPGLSGADGSSANPGSGGAQAPPYVPHPLPLAEVLAIARQIADALEAAHEQGIVHRDLKPQNIKVRADGTVKVLDFGLAKAATTGDSASGNSANSPTMTTPAMTAAGVIMGTAAYMSPEQARGRTVDRRADIWAFGCVLYEMLAGRPAFHRDTVTDTLSAILRDDPDWTPVLNTPPRIGALLHRCLHKDPKQRLRDIGEARILLDERSSGEMPNASSLVEGVTSAPSARTAWSTVAVGGITMAAFAAVATWLALRPGPAPVSLSPNIVKVTTDAGYTIEPAVSPSGTLLAYASDRGGEGLDIWVQPLPNGESVRITRNPADDRDPAFSPDGSRIVFRSDRDGGGIYEVPALGGAERLVAAKGRTPRFSPDGKWISYWTGGRAINPTTWITDGRGSAPRSIGGDVRFSAVLWCPDSTAMIGFGTNATRTGSDDWYAVDITSGASTPLGAAKALQDAGLSVSAPVAWLGDEIVFAESHSERQSLWAVPMTGCRGVAGPPHQLTTGTPWDSSPSVATMADGARMFFEGGDERTNIVRLTPGSAADTPAIVPLTADAAYQSWPSISGDGRFLAFSAERAGRTDLIVRDLTLRTSVDLTVASTDAQSGAGRTAVISPDGKTLAVVAGQRQINLQPIGGGGARPVTVDVDVRRLWDWPRPSLLTFSDTPPDARTVVFALNLDTGKTVKILDSPSSQYLGHARLSPDGKWMSLMDWVADDRGRLVVVPFDGATTATVAQVVPVTDGQTVVEENAWSPDGNTLYMVSEADGYRCLWSRRLDPRTKQPLGPLTAVAHFHRARQQVVTTTGSPQRLDMSPAGLIFAITERHSNIWMATVKK